MGSTERETLRQRLNSFTRQARKSSSIQRFEPCYRQIYPSKKRKASSFKIPKKPPYIPAVYQKKTASYRNKYLDMVSEPVRGRHLQWPPLYPCKKKDQPQAKQSDKSNELPPWLLPLYSCKTCHNNEPSLPSEVRYSGGAFHRKMEIIQTIKVIRANQPVVLGHLHKKGARTDESTHLDAIKSTNNAVEALKRKIDSMQHYLTAVRNSEALRKRYHAQPKSNELDENQVSLRQAYSRIYKTKPPSLAREVRVRKSMGIGTVGPEAFENSLPGPSNPVPEKPVENSKNVDINKGTHLPKKQNNEGNPMPEGEFNSPQQSVSNKHSTAERTNNVSLGQIYKESVVMIKQPTWKTQQFSNVQKNNDSKTNQLRASPKPTHEDSPKDTLVSLQQSRNIKTQEIKPEDEGNRTVGDAWTVASLKTRINVMKINKSTIEEPTTKKAEDANGTRNGGELRPKISQVALRSFHKEVGSKYPINTQSKGVAKFRLGYHRTVGRRNFSTSRHPTMEREATASGNRRKIFSTSHAKNRNNKKVTWLNRLKKCFVLKRIRSPKCNNWKEAPRQISYESKHVEYNSPAPILWRPYLEENLEKHKNIATNKRTQFTRERVNPAILNAEQRVLAGISKLVSAKSQPNIPGVRALDIEKKISRATHKVNMMPWLKEPKNYDSGHRLVQTKSCDVRLDQVEPQGTGYEWILKNREMVEDLKRQSRYAAGKSLVPTDVKNSINQYKLPLRAEISQYRKKLDQKCSEIYVYSTSKRWYSTCYAGKHRRILPCSDVILVKKRGFKTNEYPTEVVSSKFIDRKTRSNVDLGIDFRRSNPGADNLGRKIDDPSENPEEEKRPRKWAWKIPNKTRTFTPRPAPPLTSPNKSTTRMSEMSSCALKKQVEELKRLIKKAREEVAEKTEDVTMGLHPGDSYEARLKRLIKAAHNNAQKMQIVEPRYTSENNMMANKTSSGKRGNSQPMIQYDAKPDTSKTKPEVSVLKSLFRKTCGEPKSLADEILNRNNLTALPGSSKKPEKTISGRVYIKLKSLVEAVKKKSAMLDAISDAKLLAPPSLKGNMSMNAVLPVSERRELSNGPENKTKQINLETVELLAERTPAPSNTIQLWKGESKPIEFCFIKEKEPTYGDLMTLFTKAKEIFYYQPPGLENETKGKQVNEMLGDHKNRGIRQSEKITQKEMSKNWLSIREDVSKAARAISELKDDPSGRIECTPQSSPLLSSQTKLGTDPLTQFMMAKPRILPMKLLKPNAEMNCDHMWANVPINIQENEDLCEKTGSDIDSNQLVRQHTEPSTIQDPIVDETTATRESNQHEQPRVILEPTKSLFQKPLITWESISHNFGSNLGRNLFGKPAENQESPRQDALFKRNPVTDQNPKIEDTSETPKSSDSDTAITLHQDNNAHYQIPETSSQSLHIAPTTHPADSPHNTAALSTNDQESNNHSIEEQNCIQNLGPLEEKVRRYENYYRRHFTEDPISRYEHLHQVYADLNKLDDLNECQIDDKNNDNQSKLKMETFKETNDYSNHSVSNSGLQKTPERGNIQTTTGNEKILAPDFQGSPEIQPNNQYQNIKPGCGSDIFEVPEVAILENPDGNASGDIHSEDWKVLSSPHEISNVKEADCMMSEQCEEQHCRNTAFDKGRRMIKINGSGYSEPVIESSDTEKPIIPKSEALATDPDKMNVENYSTRTKNELGEKHEKTEMFEHLLTKDPTLNPAVVKKLKLPVIMSDDSHAEKNWYTRFQSSSHRNS